MGRLREFDGDQGGQVTLLFVFASIGFVILIAFILDAAAQTTRKIQMQGAADAAAVSGGTWMARGMNLMALNNKGMADVLSVMIVIHAAAQTANQMSTLLIPIGTALEANVEMPTLAALGAELLHEASSWSTVGSELGSIDDQLSGPGGSGWQMMANLDQLNQTIKVSLPPMAMEQAAEYANKNGADTAPYAWLLSGVQGPTPVFPVGRSAPQLIAEQADNCSLPVLEPPAETALVGACSVVNGFLPPCVSGLMAIPMFDAIVRQNVNNLEGGAPPSSRGYFSPTQLGSMTDGNGNSIQSVLNQYNSNNPNSPPVSIGSILNGAGFALGTPLSWDDPPPRPMMLTDQPQPSGDATLDPNATFNLDVVRHDLQYLALAVGAVKPLPMGGTRFVNPVPFNKWITYGEADVYNPTNWDMFTQNWRVKLARAMLLGEKWQEIAGLAGVGGSADFSFVNTH